MIAGDPSGVGSLVAEDFEVLRDTKAEASSLTDRSPRETLAKLSKTFRDRLEFHPKFRQEEGRIVDPVSIALIDSVAIGVFIVQETSGGGWYRE